MVVLGCGFGVWGGLVWVVGLWFAVLIVCLVLVLGCVACGVLGLVGFGFVGFVFCVCLVLVGLDLGSWVLGFGMKFGWWLLRWLGILVFVLLIRVGIMQVCFVGQMFCF